MKRSLTLEEELTHKRMRLEFQEPHSNDSNYQTFRSKHTQELWTTLKKINSATCNLSLLVREVFQKKQKLSYDERVCIVEDFVLKKCGMSSDDLSVLLCDYMILYVMKYETEAADFDVEISRIIYLVEHSHWNKSRFAALCYNLRGMCKDNLRQLNDAIADYSRAIEIEPQLSCAYNNRGRAYRKLNCYELSLEDHNKCIEISSSSKSYNNRAVLYLRMGKHCEAIDDFSQAVELDPTNTTAIKNRAALYSKIHRYDKSIEDLTLAIYVDPNDPSIYVRRSGIYSKIGNYIHELHDLTTACTIDTKIWCKKRKQIVLEDMKVYSADPLTNSESDGEDST